MPKEINRTWVTLIPKVEGAVDIKDFRPISMIGSLYKIVAKILSKRLSKVLPTVIGETQAAFVKGRQILDGALVANEVVWWVKKTRQKATILKLDFQKAYDTVRWSFLQELMQGMGFGDKWTTWIMECVRTTSMSILVNGSPTSSFHLQRGLRQGDPLSPFLFLLVAEAFNRLVINGKELGEFEGILVGRKQIPITHLQFADDTILFTPADKRILDNYKKFLKCFALLSGLKINYQKSTLIPLNCEDGWIAQVQRSLGCDVSKLPITYLGIPLGASPRKAQTWKPVIDKVEKRLSLWKARSLSKAGRLVLIKSVLNSIPMYYLSLFRMPKKVANRIIQLQRRFFWGKKEGEKGGCLISWETIQKPRSQGGLGVGDILIKNASLLFKWWWRFADNRSTLWKEIVESNHDTTHLEDFQRMNNKNRSCVWGQITDFRSFSKEVQEVASKGIRMKIGNGAHTRFWFDNWAGGNSLRLSFPRLFMLSTQKQDLVREMGIWVSGEWRWVFNWRRNLFAWEEESFRDLINVVNLTKLSENVNDRRVWSSDLSNSFSVSDFGLQVTKIMEDESSPQVQGRLAWRNIAPPRAQLQVWFLLQGKINTKEMLFRLGAARIEDDRCILCKEETETVEHLFFCCKSSSNLWYHCCKCWDLSFCLPKDPKTCLLSWVGTPFRRFDKRLWTAMFYVVVWTIWDIRNKMAFQDFEPNWEFEKKRLFWRLGTWAKGWCPDFPFAPGLLEDELKVVRGWAGTRAPRRGRLC